MKKFFFKNVERNNILKVNKSKEISKNETYPFNSL